MSFLQTLPQLIGEVVAQIMHTVISQLVAGYLRHVQILGLQICFRYNKNPGQKVQAEAVPEMKYPVMGQTDLFLQSFYIL